LLMLPCCLVVGGVCGALRLVPRVHSTSSSGGLWRR
jgi:hypothetical protein